MSESIVNKKNFNILSPAISLLKCYHDLKCDVPTEFLEDNLSSFLKKEEDAPLVGKLFLEVVRHEQFLEMFVQEFYKKIKRIVRTDKYDLLVLTYVIVFYTKETDLDYVARLLLTRNFHNVMQLISFIGSEAGIMILTKTATAYFDQDYVKDTILKEVLNSEDIFKRLRATILKLKPAPVKKECTKPQHIKVLTHIKRVPLPPCNTRDKELKIIKANIVPETTYIAPKTNKILRHKHSLNWKQALQMLAVAQQQPQHLTMPLRRDTPEEQPYIPTIKPSPAPVFKEPSVPIKYTTSTVLRQAARIVKVEEQEIQRVKNLALGALDYTQFEKLYEELKVKEEDEQIRAIEKKHLKGLLTYEEAILAKRRCLESNKKNRIIFEKQKKELEKQLKEFKQREEEKIKQIILKTQQVQKSVDEKKQNLLHTKKKIVQELNEKSRQLMLELFRQRTEQLLNKIAMIKEIKSLHSLRITKKKEFDDTETMNIGLFCEMSIAELNERLTMLRAEMKEELEVRQEKIKKEKIRQQKFLNRMQTVIDIDNYERTTKAQTAEPKNSYQVVEADEEMILLRKKLHEKRMKRKSGII